MPPHRPTSRTRRHGRVPLGCVPVTPAPEPVVGRPARGRGRGVAALVATLSAAGLTACSADQAAEGGTPPAPPSTAASSGSPESGSPGSAARSGSSPAARPGAVRVLATGLEAPWGIAFLPGGDALVTERDSARILRVPAAGGAPTEVQRLSEVDGQGEGGLLGIAVSPRYAADGLVYVYYSTGQDNRIARMRLGQSPQPIVTGIPRSGIHNGGRLVFGPTATSTPAPATPPNAAGRRTSARSAARCCG